VTIIVLPVATRLYCWYNPLVLSSWILTFFYVNFHYGTCALPGVIHSYFMKSRFLSPRAYNSHKHILSHTLVFRFSHLVHCTSLIGGSEHGYANSVLVKIKVVYFFLMTLVIFLDKHLLPALLPEFVNWAFQRFSCTSHVFLWLTTPWHLANSRTHTAGTTTWPHTYTLLPSGDTVRRDKTGRAPAFGATYQCRLTAAEEQQGSEGQETVYLWYKACTSQSPWFLVVYYRRAIGVQ
jgi:hypothetical protein